MEIPQGWIKSDNISDIISTLESGKRPKGGVSKIVDGIPSIGGEHLKYDGKFNFVNIKFIPKDFFENMKQGKIQQNDILVVKDGATTGKTAFVDLEFPYDKAAVNEHVFIIRPTIDLIPKFLFYYLRSNFAQKIILGKTKGDIGGINTSFVNDFPIMYPKDKKIQEKIIKKLDIILGKVEEKKNKITKQFEKNILLLENITGTKKGRSRQLTLKDHVTDTLINSITIKCEKFTKNHYFDDLVNCCIDIIDTPHSTVTYFESGVPVIRTTNVEPYKINFSNCKFTSNEIYEERKKKIEPKIGDILYSREAPWGIASKVEQEKFVVGQRILLLRPNSEKIQSDFLNLVLNSSFGYNQAKSVVNETTSGHVNIGDIKKFKIPIIPKFEQNNLLTKIDKNLDVYDIVEEKLKNVIYNQRKILDYLQNLNSSILNSAFSGKLVS